MEVSCQLHAPAALPQGNKRMENAYLGDREVYRKKTEDSTLYNHRCENPIFQGKKRSEIHERAIVNTAIKLN
jgi:hypothetical protein